METAISERNCGANITILQPAIDRKGKESLKKQVKKRLDDFRAQTHGLLRPGF